VAGRAHRQPPHEAEVHVGVDLHAEDADVEVEGLVLVGNEDGGKPDGSAHGGEPTDPPSVRAVPKLLDPAGLVHAFTKHVGTDPSPSCSGPSRYSLGEQPTISRNVRLNVAKLVQPTSTHTCETDRSVRRSRSIARSMRRRCR